jgi:hypothetical protein
LGSCITLSCTYNARYNGWQHSSSSAVERDWSGIIRPAGILGTTLLTAQSRSVCGWQWTFIVTNRGRDASRQPLLRGLGCTYYYPSLPDVFHQATLATEGHAATLERVLSIIEFLLEQLEIGKLEYSNDSYIGRCINSVWSNLNKYYRLTERSSAYIALLQ